MSQLVTVDAVTTKGSVRGLVGHGAMHFAGIPFAAPPVGPLRFRPPVPHESWTEVRDATTPGAIAPQVDFMAMMLGTEPEPQDEACLFLNVFTPALDDAARPVMVWIHGGAFVLGSGSGAGYDGTSLVQRGDVVVVSINYRLGALGFLYLDHLDPSLAGSGNLGILDQVAALEWVRDNIAGFGGDPGNVTIFGESAGGMSVGTLLAASPARGLFHKAIPQSGACHNVSPAGHAEEITNQFMAACGVATIDELLAIPAADMVNAQQAFTMRFFGDVDGQIGAGSQMRLPFQPVVDGVVLAEPAIDSVIGGSASGIPVLTGTCLDEWNLFSFLDAADVDDHVVEQRLSKVFPDGAAAVAVYRADLPGKSPKEIFGNAVTDLVFRNPMHRLTEALMANGSPVFNYLFTWAGPMLGACHAIDVPFVFGDVTSPGLAMLLGGNAPQSLVDAVQESWVAFARTGDPSNHVVGEWPAYSADERSTIELTAATTVLIDPQSSRRELWATLD